MKNLKGFQIFFFLFMLLIFSILLGYYSANENHLSKSRLMRSPPCFSALSTLSNFPDSLSNSSDSLPKSSPVSLSNSSLSLSDFSASNLIEGILQTATENSLCAFATRKIEVAGEATVFATPEIAVINLGVIEKSSTAKEAELSASHSINKIIAALSSLGVLAEDIQTSYYTLSPEYSYHNHGNSLTGYSVSSSLKVTVRDIDKDIDKVGKVLRLAIQNGANSSSGISYQLDDESKYYLKALELAINNADLKAQTIANSLKLEKPLLIDIKEKQNGLGFNLKALSVSDMEYASSIVTPSKIEVRASVQATYKF